MANDCKNYEAPECIVCKENGGSENVGCYEPLEATEKPRPEPSCSHGKFWHGCFTEIIYTSPYIKSKGGLFHLILIAMGISHHSCKISKKSLSSGCTGQSHK